jgi:hypothetical protein
MYHGLLPAIHGLKEGAQPYKFRSEMNLGGAEEFFLIYPEAREFPRGLSERAGFAVHHLSSYEGLNDRSVPFILFHNGT